MNTTAQPSAKAFRTFLKNKTALTGGVYILVFILIAFFAPFLQADPSPDANAQELLVSKKKPGFTIQELRVKKANEEKQNSFKTWYRGGKEPNYNAYPIQGVSIKNQRDQNSYKTNRNGNARPSDQSAQKIAAILICTKEEGF